MGLFGFLFGNKKDVRVEASHSIEVLHNSLINEFKVASIKLRIINNSGKTIFIENPYIKTYKKIQGKNEHYIPGSIELYPFKLRESNVHSIKFSPEHIFFDKLATNSKIRFVVTDTLGNKYSSKKYKVSEFFCSI